MLLFSIILIVIFCWFKPIWADSKCCSDTEDSATNCNCYQHENRIWRNLIWHRGWGIILSPWAFEMIFFSAELSSKLSNKIYDKNHHFLTPCPPEALKKLPEGPLSKDGQFSLFLNPCQIGLIWLHSYFITLYRRNSQSFCLCNL